MIGVISIFITSFRDSINAAVDRNLSGDFQVDSGAFSGSGGGLSPELAARLSEQPELSAVTGIRVGTVAGAREDAARSTASTAGRWSRLAHLGVSAGRLADLDRHGIAVAETNGRRRWAGRSAVRSR